MLQEKAVGILKLRTQRRSKQTRPKHPLHPHRRTISISFIEGRKGSAIQSVGAAACTKSCFNILRCWCKIARGCQHTFEPHDKTLTIVRHVFQHDR